MNSIQALLRYLFSPIQALLRVPAKLVSAPRRLMGLSLPARVAVTLGFFLTLCAILGLFFAAKGRDSAHRDEVVNWINISIITLLVIVISVAVYYTLKAWLEGSSSPYPDIETAWQQGLAALAENNLDLTETPLFVVLGAMNERHADSLFTASGFELLVRSVPSGHAPLRWYANQNAIYLVCNALGCLGRLNELARGGQGSSHSFPQTPAPNITGTLVSGGASSISRTMTAASITDSGPSFGGSIKGTLVAGVQGTLIPGAQSTDGPRGVPSAAQTLTRKDADEQANRLQFVCQLLRRARQPLCPLNGIVALLTLDTIRDIVFAKEMAECIQNDLGTIRENGRVSCSVSALVTGMEAEPGFLALMRRIGVERCKTTRFGKGFQVWNEPTAENLDALSAHACGAFEDWVYSLFREKNGLAESGNRKLYTLLCRVRSQMQSRLTNIIRQGFSSDGPAGSKPEAKMLFAGCYFTATGETPDKQAFVRSALERMTQLEEDLEWTDAALEEDRRYHQLAQVGLMANGLMVLGLVAMVVKRFWLS